MELRKLLVVSMLATGAVTLAPSSMAAVLMSASSSRRRHLSRPEVRCPRRVYGYTWAPGYWRWNGHRHVWHSGYYVQLYPGRHWVAHRWEHRGGRWYSHEGHWG